MPCITVRFIVSFQRPLQMFLTGQMPGVCENFAEPLFKNVIIICSNVMVMARSSVPDVEEKIQHCVAVLFLVEEDWTQKEWMTPVLYIDKCFISIAEKGDVTAVCIGCLVIVSMEQKK